jgi:hypothetical protein
VTVIANLISNGCTVHATDSLLLSGELEGGGVRTPHHRSGMPKVIIVSRFRGAMSWWGRVSAGEGWNLYDWLVERAGWLQHHEGDISAEEYAEEVTRDLNRTLEQSHLNNADGTKGIGIHFTCYERAFDNTWIPELYLITNERGADNEGRYEAAGQFECYRRTYFDLKHKINGDWDVDYARHGNATEREFVRNVLETNRLVLCNGTPNLFEQLAQPTWEKMADATTPVTESHNTGILSRPETLYPLTLVRAIVDEQIKTQTLASRTVGHPCHDLVVSSAGEYLSRTGISSIPDDRITGLQLDLAEARDREDGARENDIIDRIKQQCQQLGRDVKTSLAAAPSLAQIGSTQGHF